MVLRVRSRTGFEQHAVGRDVARGGLVHVVPDSGDPRGHVRRVQLAPPGSRGLGREVGKDRVPGPHLPDVAAASRRAAEDVTLQPLVVDPVAGVVLDAWIDDGDDLEPRLVEALQHAGSIGKALVVPREDPVLVHVVDVEPQGVARNVVRAVASAELLHLVLRVGVPPALVIPQRPQRR